MKKKRKKVSASKYTATVVILLLVFITLLVVEFILVRFTDIFDESSKKLEGTWSMAMETSDYTALEIGRWLDDVSDYDADGEIEKLRTKLADCDVTCEISFDTSSMTYQIAVSEDEYNRCYEEAIQTLTSILDTLISKRIESSGISQSDIGMSVDELVVETIGMSIDEYIRTKGPKIMPSLEQIAHDTNHSGGYQVDKDVLSLEGNGEYTFMVDDDTLVLTDAEGKSVAFDKIQSDR